MPIDLIGNNRFSQCASGPSVVGMTTSTTSDRWDARLWGVLAVLCTVLFLDALDVSMVGVALPSIREDLSMSTASLQWVVSGYVLGYGGLLLLGGRAADLWGRRRVLLVALAVFVVASLLGGLVDDGGLLIAARLVKGMSAAFTAPAALSILTTTFAEGPARNKALSIFTACGASGYSLGLVLSGFLTEVGWRWTFLMPVPVAIAVLIAAHRLIPRQPRPDHADGRYDVLGAVTVTASMLLLVYTVVEAPDLGWGAPQTLAGLAGSAVLLTAFVVTERTVRHPLIRLGILRSAPRARANFGLVVLFGSYLSFQFVATQYYQGMLGWSALETALSFLPGGILVALLATRMGKLASQYGTAKPIAVGAGVLVAGYVVILRGIDEDPNLATVVLPGMLLLGVAWLAFPALSIQAVAGVPDDEQGLAAGLLNTAGQVGGAVVLAVVTAVLTSNGGPDTLDGIRTGIAASAGLAVIGLAVSLTAWRSEPATAVEPAPEEELVDAG
jgi:MFS family permease